MGAFKVLILLYTYKTFFHVCACVLSCFSCVRLFATPWTVACQAPLSIGFSRQEYWSGLPCPSSREGSCHAPPDPGIKPECPALAGGFFTTEPPGKPSFTYAAAAKSLQSCPTLCDPIDSSPPGAPVPRILQARTLEWVAVSFSNA